MGTYGGRWLSPSSTQCAAGSCGVVNQKGLSTAGAASSAAFIPLIRAQCTADSY